MARLAQLGSDLEQESGIVEEGISAGAVGGKNLSEHLICDALESVVSAFDGFGREICARKGTEIRFQSLVGARKRVQEVFKFDFADGLSAADWDLACRLFQKRHLPAHKMGVIDEDYVQKAKDPGAIVGRKVRVTSDEVAAAIAIGETLGGRLYAGVIKTAA
jgi:hypothetical protein